MLLQPRASAEKLKTVPRMHENPCFTQNVSNSVKIAGGGGYYFSNTTNLVTFCDIVMVGVRGDKRFLYNMLYVNSKIRGTLVSCQMLAV